MSYGLDHFLERVHIHVAIVVSKGFVEASKLDRVTMAKDKALSHVVPDFGVLLRMMSLG